MMVSFFFYTLSGYLHMDPFKVHYYRYCTNDTWRWLFLDPSQVTIFNPNAPAHPPSAATHPGTYPAFERTSVRDRTTKLEIKRSSTRQTRANLRRDLAKKCGPTAYRSTWIIDFKIVTWLGSRNNRLQINRECKLSSIAWKLIRSGSKIAMRTKKGAYTDTDVVRSHYFALTRFTHLVFTHCWATNRKNNGQHCSVYGEV